MKVRIGTSGYSYKQWKGRFYPKDLPAGAMLAYYAERFPTVEINNTFYRMPRAEMLARWAETTPEGFTFVLKAPQRITHHKRLADVGADLSYFFEAARSLGGKRGPVLFQLPPHMKRDIERLRAFLAGLPPEVKAAFEFRHDSWSDPEVTGLLEGHGAALCQADTDEEPVASLLATAPWGYLRLRRTAYTAADLEAWAARIRGQGWQEVFVFLKHEDEARGPEFAAGLQRALSAAPGPT